MKIAILLADTPLPAVVETHGDYNAIFTRLLQRTGERMGLKVETEAFDAVAGHLPSDPSALDAILITGSKYSAYEQIPWILKLIEFIQTTDKTQPQVKFIGICFGHQIISQALGGQVTKNPRGWEVGWTLIQLNDQGRKYLHTARTDMRIHQMHQDEVSKPPPNFQTIASTAVCQCQAMVQPGRYLTIQAHPEFTADIVREVIRVRHDKGVFSPEQSQQWLAVVEQPLDSDWFTEKILQFINSGNQ